MWRCDEGSTVAGADTGGFLVAWLRVELLGMTCGCGKVEESVEDL
jgi:hypothetical protein